MEPPLLPRPSGAGPADDPASNGDAAPKAQVEANARCGPAPLSRTVILMSGYLAYEAWNEHLADLHRAAAANRRIERRPQRPAARPVRKGLRRLRQALAA
jgi:hypothetical protein